MKIFKSALIGSLLGLTASVAQAAGIQIKFGHVGGPDSLFELSVNEFARIANEKLQGKAKVVAYGSSQLGSDSQMLNKLKLGSLDLALPSTVMSSVAPEFSLFEMPYLISNREHMVRVREEVVRDVMYKAAEKRGYTVVGVWENGFRQITNNARPIVVPADLKGLKLRTPNGIWRVAMFQSYGANPAPMALSEAFVALQTGAMDGQENPLVQSYSQRFHEVQKYLSMSNHVYTPAFVVAGASWKRLPEDVRKVLSDAAKEVEGFALEQGRMLDESLVKKMAEAGMEVNEIDQKTFIEGSEKVYAKFADEVEGGQAMLDKVTQLRQL